MYDKKKLFAKIKRKVKADKLIFISEIAPILGISRSTIYKHFPIESDEYSELENLLLTNRVKEKMSIRNELRQSGNVHALMKLYRLLADPDEIARLTGDIENLKKSSNENTFEKSQLEKIREAIRPDPEKVAKLFEGINSNTIE